MEKKDIDNFAEILIEKSEKYDEKTSERFLSFKNKFFIWFNEDIKQTLLDYAKDGKRKIDISFSNFPRGKGTLDDMKHTSSDVIEHYMKLINNDYFNGKLKMSWDLHLVERTCYVSYIDVQFTW